MATPLAQAEYVKFYDALGGKPVHHTLATHWARLIELLYAAEHWVELACDPEITSKEYRVLPTKTPTEGVGSVEAPRGTLTHHYTTDERGILTKVNLIVGTTNNNAAICMSVKKAAQTLIHKGQVATEGLLNMVEMAFRPTTRASAARRTASPARCRWRSRCGIRRAGSCSACPSISAERWSDRSDRLIGPIRPIVRSVRSRIATRSATCLTHAIGEQHKDDVAHEPGRRPNAGHDTQGPVFAQLELCLDVVAVHAPRGGVASLADPCRDVRPIDRETGASDDTLRRGPRRAAPRRPFLGGFRRGVTARFLAPSRPGSAIPPRVPDARPSPPRKTAARPPTPRVPGP